MLWTVNASRKMKNTGIVSPRFDSVPQERLPDGQTLLTDGKIPMTPRLVGPRSGHISIDSDIASDADRVRGLLFIAGRAD